MNFLKKIDYLYDNEKKKYNISDNDKSFSLFIPLEHITYRTTCSFVIKKQQKAKLLLVEGQQRVYLSDLQIINTILSMPKNDVKWFLKQLALLYSGTEEKIKFKIDEDLFEGIGISKYPYNKKLLLFSDSNIDINDFIFILNFVFSKDKAWEEISRKNNFSKSTLCKYIILIDYYTYKNPQIKEFLEKIGYSIEDPYPIRDIPYYKLLKSLDISLYL